MIETIKKLSNLADPNGKLWAYIESGSFLTDPASIKRHRSVPGGLAEHSAGVFCNLHRLSGESVQVCAMAALGHDLCKVGTYQKTMKNEKRKDANGNFVYQGGRAVWDEVVGYEFTPSTMPMGHGDSSVFRLLQASGTMPPKSVILAIRWHMGAYQASAGEEMNRMGDAMALEPIVIYMQTADLLDTYRPMTRDEIVAYVEGLE